MAPLADSPVAAFGFADVLELEVEPVVWDGALPEFVDSAETASVV